MPSLRQCRCSVVVASHRPDGARRLAAHFGALLDESELPTEVIFVTDYPLAILDLHHPDMHGIHVADRSIPVKRNAGIRATSAPIVAFLDDDCLPLEGFVERGVSYLDRTPAAAGVEGLTEVEEGPAGSVADARRLERPGYRTNNIFYRRDILVEVGLFDERFSFQREDIDLAFSILDTGREIHAAHEIRVLHLFRPGEPWDLLKNCWRRRYDPLLHARHPRRYREHIGSPVPPGILLVALAWTLAAATLSLGPAVLLLPVTTASALAARRAIRARSAGTFLYDVISFLAAPAVLWAALIRGSIRFRHLLLV